MRLALLAALTITLWALPATADEEAPTAPRLLAPVELSLPPGAEVPEAGVELLLTVEPDGRASDPELLTELVDPAVREAVLSASAQLRFEPARRGETAVRARIRFRFAVAPEPPADPAAEATPQASPSAPGAVSTSVPSDAARDDADDDEAAAPSTFGAVARVDRPAPGAAKQIKLRGAELTAIPGTFGEPLRVVATLPGVARTPYGLGFFAVRGASLQNTGFLVDGFPVPLLYHLGAGPAILSSRLVERLDFYPGGYPLAYGRYNAGLVALNTAPPRGDGFQLELEVDLLRASALTVIPLGSRGSVALALRRSYYDLLLPLVTDDVSLAYTDYQLRLDYRATDRLEVALFFFGSRDTLDFSQQIGSGRTTGESQTGLTYSFDQVILSLGFRASEELKLRWASTFGPSSIEFGTDSSGSASLGADTSSLRLGQRLEAVLTPSEHLQTTLGVEENLWINELRGQAPSFAELPNFPAPAETRAAIAIEDRLQELNLAPYLEQVLRPEPFELSLGVRAEYYRYADVSTWQLEPRGVVRLRVSELLTLKAASGLFSQAPLPYEQNRSYGNPDLKPNRALQSSVGSELRFEQAWSADATVFYNQMWQLTRVSGRPVLDADAASGDDGALAFSPFFRDDGEGRAYGLELMLRREVEAGLFGWLSYTLSRSERFLEGGETVLFFFDQTHILNLALSYKVGAWRFGGRFTLTSGRPANDPLDTTGERTIYDADADDFLPQSRTARIRLPTYHQLDVRVDYDLPLGPFDGSVFLDVINVYAARNAEGYLYEYDFSKRGQLPGLPFLPTIGIRGVLR